MKIESSAYLAPGGTTSGRITARVGTQHAPDLAVSRASVFMDLSCLAESAYGKVGRSLTKKRHWLGRRGTNDLSPSSYPVYALARHRANAATGFRLD